MLSFVSSTAGALFGIAQGVYIVFRDAGSTPVSATTVVRIPSAGERAFEVVRLAPPCRGHPRRCSHRPRRPSGPHDRALLFWSSKSSRGPGRYRPRPRLTRHRFRQSLYVISARPVSQPPYTADVQANVVLQNDELEVAPTVQQDVVLEAASTETNLSSAPEMGLGPQPNPDYLLRMMLAIPARIRT